MNSLPDFQPDRPADQAHSALKQSLAAAELAQHCALLWFAEILRRKLFRELGYSSIQAYAQTELGFSRAKCGDFVRLAGRLEDLPQLKESVARGEVGYTKAREVIKVATPRTEARWVAEAAGSSRNALAAKVARVKKKAAARRANPGQVELLPAARIERELVREVPVRISLEMSSEQFARYEALWEKLYKLGGVPAGHTKADALLEALAGRAAELEVGTLKKAIQSEQGSSATSAPRGAAPYMIHLHECPSCGTATVQTSAGEKKLGPGERERIACDAVIVRPGARARSTIPPAARREVLARDHHRCQGRGCTHTRFLEIHHRRPVARGRDNEPENLVTLCAACHRLVHAGNKIPDPVVEVR